MNYEFISYIFFLRLEKDSLRSCKKYQKNKTKKKSASFETVLISFTFQWLLTYVIHEFIVALWKIEDSKQPGAE